jgi:hypothetical protein
MAQLFANLIAEKTRMQQEGYWSGNRRLQRIDAALTYLRSRIR